MRYQCKQCGNQYATDKVLCQNGCNNGFYDRLRVKPVPYKEIKAMAVRMAEIYGINDPENPMVKEASVYLRDWVNKRTPKTLECAD